MEGRRRVVSVVADYCSHSIVRKQADPGVAVRGTSRAGDEDDQILGDKSDCDWSQMIQLRWRRAPRDISFELRV